MSERAEELEMENIEIHKDEENQVKLEEKSESPARPEFLVTWTDLEYVVKVKKEEKTILSKVSGIAKPGEFLAIMGPSGAGKSSLLDILSGRNRQTAGSLLFNGKERSKKLKYVSTYVQQQDSLLSSLTTRETIYYAAKLKLSSKLSSEEIDRRVDETISLLGLEKCSETKIGNAVFRGVSGGERRRVSIGCEIVTDPQIIFLDEPTSGLDSEASYQIVSNLSNLAKSRSKTVIATIHQPSSLVYGEFDKICLLSLGRLIFYGTPDEALQFFNSIGKSVPPYFNPPEHFLKEINTDFIADRPKAVELIESISSQFLSSEFVKSIKPSEDTRQSGDDISSHLFKHANSLIFQSYILTKRSFLSARRNILLFWVRAAMFIAMAILMGTTWFNLENVQADVQNTFSVFFFSVAFLCFMSVAAIPAVIEDKLVYDREQQNGSYSISPYVVANTLTSLPFILLIALIFTTIAYPLIGLPSNFGVVCKFILMLFLALYTVESIVIIISAAFPIFVVALALVAFINGFFMVVQGYFVTLESLPDFWIWAHYWSYQTYAFEGMVSNHFNSIDVFQCATTGDSCFCSIPSSLPPGSCEFTGKDVLRAYDYEDIDYWAWFGVLVGQIAIYRFLFWAILRFKTRKQN